MEKYSATVVSQEEHHFINIKTSDEEIQIPLSEDNANAVKSAFNKLIILLKNEIFEIELEDLKEDLISHIAIEYITQLNNELKEVHAEITEYKLS